MGRPPWRRDLETGVSWQGVEWRRCDLCETVALQEDCQVTGARRLAGAGRAVERRTTKRTIIRARISMPPAMCQRSFMRSRPGPPAIRCRRAACRPSSPGPSSSFTSIATPPVGKDSLKHESVPELRQPQEPGWSSFAKPFGGVASRTERGRRLVRDDSVRIISSSRPKPSPSTSLGTGYARRSGGTFSKRFVASR
jgi:hypothetical protein